MASTAADSLTAASTAEGCSPIKVAASGEATAAMAAEALTATGPSVVEGLLQGTAALPAIGRQVNSPSNAKQGNTAPQPDVTGPAFSNGRKPLQSKGRQVSSAALGAFMAPITAATLIT